MTLFVSAVYGRAIGWNFKKNNVSSWVLYRVFMEGGFRDTSRRFVDLRAKRKKNVFHTYMTYGGSKLHKKQQFGRW